jgi:hypothetical protein
LDFETLKLGLIWAEIGIANWICGNSVTYLYAMDRWQSLLLGNAKKTCGVCVHRYSKSLRRWEMS